MVEGTILRWERASDISTSIEGSAFTGVETCRRRVGVEDVAVVLGAGFFLCDRVPLLVRCGVNESEPDLCTGVPTAVELVAAVVRVGAGFAAWVARKASKSAR